jgi:ABC-2 type transport system permease protein
MNKQPYANRTVFIVMMFSPVMYPVEQLPGWLQAVHQVFPIRYMALTGGTLTDLYN